MSAPDARDLFLNAWSAGLYQSDSLPHPGGPDFDAKVRAHWVRVWRDCQLLAKVLTDYDSLMEEASLSRDPEPG